MLPERNEAENEVDFLKELPGEREYYSTSTESNEFLPTTYSGDGDEEASGAGEPGSGDSGVSMSPPEHPSPPPAELLTFYFVRVNVDGENNNETDRQWLDFLQSNGVDLTKFQNGNGNFGVHNLMPSADVGSLLIADNSPINLTEDDMFKMAQTTAIHPAPVENEKPMEILVTQPDDVAMEVDTTKETSAENSGDHSLTEQLDTALYEFINESNLHTPFDESTENSDVPHSGDGSVEDISLIGRKDRHDDAAGAVSDDESSGETVQQTTSRSSASNDDSSRTHQKTVENDRIDSIIKRYKVLHGWSFWIA